MTAEFTKEWDSSFHEIKDFSIARYDINET
jgi:hypothetical protein